MVRARQTKILLALVVLAGGAGSTASPRAAPKAAAVAAPSPSTVLAQLSGKTGNVGYAWSRQQEPRPDSDRSLAPYLTVLGEGASGTERVPLKETSADVSIAGVIARVQVHQLFENTGQVPIEAVYVFPASTRAAVHGVRMKIGNRVIEAKIDKRQAARDSYEAARARRQARVAAGAGAPQRVHDERRQHHARRPHRGGHGLLRDADPRRGGLRVRLPDRGRAALRAAAPIRAKDKWMANPHLPAGTPEPYRFDIRVHLETGIALKELASPSHAVAVNYAGPARADVKLAQPGGGNRDFVLRYRLSGDKIESGLLLWEGEGGGGRPRSSSR